VLYQLSTLVPNHLSTLSAAVLIMYKITTVCVFAWQNSTYLTDNSYICAGFQQIGIDVAVTEFHFINLQVL